MRLIRDRIAHGLAPPSVRELAARLGYRSPNSAAYLLRGLVTAGYLRRRPDGRLQLLRDIPEESIRVRTVLVPLVGSVPCGTPLLAEENIQGHIAVDARLARPPHRYFLLRAAGTSMNRAGIQDGDLVLIRQQASAENGERVVALIDDSASIKEFHRVGDTIALKPRTTDTKTHRPIVLTDAFQVQGVVVGTISKDVQDVLTDE